MAEIQMREERLRAIEETQRIKQDRRRQQVNPGFSSSGRPQSAAGGGRRRAAAPPTQKSQNHMPEVNSSYSSRTHGTVNPSFDDPEVEEIISNQDTRQEKKDTQVLKVQVQNDEIEETDAPNTSRSVDSNKTLTDDIEELTITEPEKPKKKKKKRAKTPPEAKPDAPSPTETTLSSTDQIMPPSNQFGGLTREDTILFPGDEYYNDRKDQPENEHINPPNDFDDQSIMGMPVQPEIMAAEHRPISSMSVVSPYDTVGMPPPEEFVFQPAPQDEQIQCRITRDRHGIDNRAYPIYYLHLEKEGQKKIFLLGARKRKKTTTSSYIISTDPTDVSRKNESFVAKLRSNMMGTRFTCYDSGKAYSEPGALINPDKLRKEMVTIGYETNVLGFKGPRRMTIVVPGMDLDGERVECQPTHEKETLSAKLDAKSNDNITTLHNKSPVWNEDSQSYVLNFHGRVTQASVKNFQIVHEKEPDYIVLQFGRIADDVFTMDYKYPLCAVQAFSIALSSFDNKLACE